MRTSLQLSAFDSSVYLGVSAGSVDSLTVSILDDDHLTAEFSALSDTPGAVNYTLLVYLSNGTAKGEYNMWIEYTGCLPDKSVLGLRLTVELP